MNFNHFPRNLVTQVRRWLYLLPPSTENRQESLAEVADEPVDGKVEGSVDDLQKLDRSHGVQIPDGGDALESVHGDLEDYTNGAMMLYLQFRLTMQDGGYHYCLVD